MHTERGSAGERLISQFCDPRLGESDYDTRQLSHTKESREDPRDMGELKADAT
jgi:hypothetical protein